jgi:hypothetical protein
MTRRKDDDGKLAVDLIRDLCGKMLIACQNKFLKI